MEQQEINKPTIKNTLLPDNIIDSAISHDIRIINKITANQRTILEHYEEGIQPLVLEGTPLDGGSVQHYYHFVLDLLLPLSILIKRTPSDMVFNFFYLGPLTAHLEQLFGERVNILKEENEDYKCLPLIGMSPVGLREINFNLGVLRNTVINRFIKKTPQIDIKKIILIERVAPDPFYMTEAVNKGGGSQRRSIVNYSELRALIEQKISNQYEFVNLVLEEMTFEEQVQQFNTASLVIGLHGAGLSNIIWMKPECQVIEIGFRSCEHFQRISQIMRHHHLTYMNFEEVHITIDIPHFSSWLDAQPELTAFMKVSTQITK
ncbi:MAG: glycosyltransferase 61 family protein [Saprospiraceae bacterium]